jgi:hypothetical protein
MAIGTVFGYVTRTVAATPGNRSWVAVTAFLAAATVHNTFLVVARGHYRVNPGIEAVNLTLGAVAIKIDQEA